MEIIAVGNQKGGVGKSTTAAALSQAASFCGLKVLALDLDPQCNLTFFLSADANRPGSYDLLKGTATASKTIQQHRSGNVDVIPASRNLASITSSTGSARRLQKAIEPIRGAYDLILIDLPPTLGELVYNALQASTALIVPMQSDVVSMHGLNQIVDVAKQIQASNPQLRLAGTILTRHNSRSIINRQIAENIMQKSKDLGIPFLGVVREGISIREAQTLQRDLFDYSPKSNPARDYMHILKKIMPEVKNDA